MRYMTPILVLTVVNLAVSGTTHAEVLGYEVWKQGWVLEGGREQNEPLNQALHMTDSRLAVGLNKSTLISRSGYTFCGATGWAFTFKPSESWIYWDFTDEGITPDLQFTQNNTGGASFRVLIANAPGGEYAVSETVYNAGGWPETSVDLSLLNWLSFDPSDLSLGSAVTPDLSNVFELGFASGNAANNSRIDNILIQGRTVPEPSSIILLLACAAIASMPRRRRGMSS